MFASKRSGVNAAQSGGKASPKTCAQIISALMGANSQPLRECPHATSTGPLGPIIGAQSGDIGRTPTQALAPSRSLTSPGSARA